MPVHNNGMSLSYLPPHCLLCPALFCWPPFSFQPVPFSFHAFVCLMSHSSLSLCLGLKCPPCFFQQVRSWGLTLKSLIYLRFESILFCYKISLSYLTYSVLTFVAETAPEITRERSSDWRPHRDSQKTGCNGHRYLVKPGHK